MKVKELIARLTRLDPESEVMLQHPAHDYWRNMLACIPRDIGTVMVEWSDYHDSWRRMTDKDLDKSDILYTEPADGSKRKSVVIISDRWDIT